MTNTQTTTDDQQGLSIPTDVAKKFHDLIELIKESRSMDDDERQYWIDVLPIMSDDQITNLRGILENEKEETDEAEENYNQGMAQAVKNVANEFDEVAYQEKKRARLEAEKKHEEEEKAREEDILKELENL